ncbi:MAG: F0F1 ATP synthase subunit gamma [Gammaproteobacteria bacterium RIFCSPHIGHO2_12_FULL_35_23]|nr:MAG: F0F1 ATP synthase subunit gamma [Gammaproteobacteria bacterium RIFCSPHIGHO2_12_FULL_35_23]
MTVAREIKSKIGSIKSTQKITRAMEMVAASKMRKAQDRMKRSKPYAEKIRDVIHHLACAHPEYRHPFLEVREIKKIGVIIVSTDRGLCGSLNSNLFKSVITIMKDFSEKNIAADLCLIGNRADAYFRRIGGNVIAKAHHLGDAPGIEQLIGIVKVMLDAYSDKQIDALHIFYNEFINTMIQRPLRIQLLPIVPDPSKAEEAKKHHWDYLYEPDAKQLLKRLLKNYIESQVYQGVIENIACQQAATMVAMKSATDNAGKIISDLQLAYNKARQAAITREISEIISGADAVS